MLAGNGLLHELLTTTSLCFVEVVFIADNFALLGEYVFLLLDKVWELVIRILLHLPFVYIRGFDERVDKVCDMGRCARLNELKSLMTVDRSFLTADSLR